ncbi:MAG: TonB-dependent receptor [Melioribacteraceae bacterium]|nr:TonB-dependent receptor [Melioribacteraceae bacterium]MCF8355082.1 TonB-dependent receptor [Melioribacteraceae bacterium]MCF8394649.1 TonB-dependent receptor [Melioribacteraceae bacterium]MCF8420300.1 TonB-dependent receptor [Melioribacteraceae bacterium]
MNSCKTNMWNYTVRFTQKLFLLTILVLFFQSSVHSQEYGKISGIVVDGDLGEALIGTNIIVEGTSIGAATDLDGNFLIEAVPPGTYNVIFSSIGFAKKTVTGVSVEPGKVVKLDITMLPETFETDEVVITAKAVENSEAGLLIKRQKATAVGDAVSSEQFSRAGSSNAADAVKQVVGASVVDGKYVFVRGLGDRYTSTQLNGAEIPSVDPYRRSGSIDLIPSNLVDNIQAVKSFTPDKPGSFSGGMVDIKTKDFPEKLNFSFSTSTSYNTQSTFKDNFLGVYSGGTDWLGYDNGYRSVPGAIGDQLLEFDAGAAVTNDSMANFIDSKTSAFNSDMNVNRAKPPLNQSYSLSVGNQIDLFGKPLGFLASLTYKRNFSGYNDGQLNRWDRGTIDPTKTSLDTAMAMSDMRSTDEVLWGSVAKLSYKFHPNHIISINGLINQNGENTSRYIFGSYPYDMSPDNTWEAKINHYKERKLQSIQLSGEHFFGDFLDLRMEWKGSMMGSIQNEPDIRYMYSFVTPDTLYGIKSNLTPERFFRNTDEVQKEAQLDLSFPFKMFNSKQLTFKFGGFYSKKDREFKERRFSYQPTTKMTKFYNEAEGQVDKFFSDEFMGLLGQDTIIFRGDTTVRNLLGLYVEESNQISSNYDADQEISAFYGMFDAPVFDWFRLVFGARMENTNLFVKNQTDSIGTINTHDLLPSVNMIFTPFKDMNIRVSYGRTLARPTFREISPFTNYDFNGGDQYRGNTKLKRTLIDNYDLRWEWYSRPGEVFAVSGFYKKFYDPIELKIEDAVNQVLTWTNVPQAYVMGLEFEARTRLDFVTDVLSNFTVGGNLSLIKSEVDIDADELVSIKAYDSTASNTRPFQGQSPFIFNAYINYDNYDAGWSAGIYYNVFGKRLVATGSVGAPDMYEEPFHMLNLSVSKSLFEVITMSLSVTNLLNYKQERTQEFKGTKYIYTAHTMGTNISLGLKYQI